MRRTVVFLVLLAIAAAAGAAYLVERRLQQERVATASPSEAPAPRPTTRIVVAARDLPSGTVVAATDVKLAQWPSDMLPPNAITEGSLAFGTMVVRLPVPHDTPLLPSQMVPKGEGGTLSYVLPPGRVGATISVSSISGVGGHISPGDFVDVLFTHSVTVPPALTPASDGTTERGVTETLLERLKVLAIDLTTDDASGAHGVVSTATLEVSPKEAEMLTLAQTVGNLSLALTSATKASDDPAMMLAARRSTIGSFTFDTELSAVYDVFQRELQAAAKLAAAQAAARQAAEEKAAAAQAAADMAAAAKAQAIAEADQAAAAKAQALAEADRAAADRAAQERAAADAQAAALAAAAASGEQPEPVLAVADAPQPKTSWTIAVSRGSAVESVTIADLAAVAAAAEAAEAAEAAGAAGEGLAVSQGTSAAATEAVP